MKPLSLGRRSKSCANHASTVLPSLSLSLDLGDFPNQLDLLAKDLVSFLLCLQDLPDAELTDDSFMSASVSSFAGDLTYWASCLKDFDGKR